MYDLIIKNCSVMMPDFSIKKEQDILIQDSFYANGNKPIEKYPILLIK